MKILYVNTLYSPDIKGGAEISLKLLVEGMKVQGHEVVVAALRPEGQQGEDVVDGVHVYRCGLRNLYWPYVPQRPKAPIRLAWHWKDRYNEEMKRQLADIISRERPDVVSCHNLAGWSIAVWDAAKEQGVPVVQVLHDLYLLCANSDMFKGDKPCKGRCFSCQVLRLSHARKSRQLDAVVGISHTVLRRFERFGYFQEVPKEVIYNARFIADKGRHAKAETFRIGYLGTLSPKKGLNWLITQFKERVKPARKAELFIAGNGQDDYVCELHQLALGDQRIHFLGHQPSDQFYAEIDVLVVPSLWEEPLGMVAIEALAHHIPVIANEVGGLAETVIHQENGLLVHGDAPNSLGDAMNRLVVDASLYEVLASHARKSVAHFLSVPRMTQEYEQLLNKVVNDNKEVYD
ncbi:glycosyltransferase family 4 protein [Olivibacter sitiensis]|uniref:glycosyltransferase family 4 protein n=1 Tax=Olivibacter sitiensis TaxID=376470 RepID=UPI0003FF6CC4|nr:glycosyltransferase family 4 protein [Olivibacter sitiensis]